MATTDPRQLTGITTTKPHALLATTPGRRTILLATVLAAMAGAALLAQPNPSITADPELAFVLRGMAVIKLAIAALALTLVWWRAAAPTTATRFLAYTTCTTLLATTATLVFKLAVIAPTSIIFHATLITIGLLALGDTAIAKGALKRKVEQRR